MGRVIAVLLFFICIVPAPDAAGKRLECRINPKSNLWKKQGGAFPESGTLPTTVTERFAL